MKKNKTLALIGAILLATTINAQTLTKQWEVTNLEAPESVLFDTKTEHFYVTNVSGQPAEKNGLGFISKIDQTGNVAELKWATGFNAPKGIGIYKDRLYVADIDVVHEVELTTGKIAKSYAAEGATFLNDVEISKDGTVYITDTFGGNAIYRIKDGQIDLWLKDESLGYPNGLLLDGKELLVASWGVVTNPQTFETEVPGNLLAINLKSKEIRVIAKTVGNLDGLVRYSNEYIVSDWISGKIFKITKGGIVTQLLTLSPGTADINLKPKSKVLLIPIMLEGKLEAYSIDLGM